MVNADFWVSILCCWALTPSAHRKVIVAKNVNRFIAHLSISNGKRWREQLGQLAAARSLAGTADVSSAPSARPYGKPWGTPNSGYNSRYNSCYNDLTISSLRMRTYV